MKSKPDDGPTPRELLSQNLRALMNAHDTLTSIKKVAEATKDFRLNGEDVHLSNGKVGRIAAGSHTTDIDALHSLAKAFGLQPWQLLVEGLNPNALPKLADAGFVEQLVGILRSADATGARKDDDRATPHQVERKPGQKMSPAVKRALDVEGGAKDARRSAGRVQKPRTRRGA